MPRRFKIVTLFMNSLLPQVIDTMIYSFDTELTLNYEVTKNL